MKGRKKGGILELENLLEGIRMDTRRITFSTVVILISAAVMVLALFLPYASALPEFADMLALLPAGEILESLGVTASSAVRISMAEFVGIYLPVNKMIGLYYGLLVAVMGVTAVLCFVFALLRKPVAALSCDLLAVVALILHNCSYANRGVVPGTAYRYGIGYYLLYLAAVAAITGAILMIKEGKKDEA